MQNLVQHGVDRRCLVFQPVLQFVDDQFAVFFFFDQTLGDFPLLRDDGPVVLDTPYRQAADRPENQQQRQAGGIGGHIAEIDGDAEHAAGKRGHDPDPEAAKRGGEEHGRKIRRKEHVGRICASPQRAMVASARQQAAKPALKSSEGWEMPCQPRLNSSINFVIGIVTSRDQRIQNKADTNGNRGFRGRRRLCPAGVSARCSLALFPAGGNIGANKN